MVYQHTINYTGLNGTPKTRVACFVINKQDALANMDLLRDYEGIMARITKDVDAGIEVTEKDGISIMKALMNIIELGYAEVDFDNDIIDKSPEALHRFKMSVAWSQLFDDITEDQTIALDLVNGIASTINLSDEDQDKADKLKEEYARRITRQNDNKTGLAPVPASPVVNRREALLAELALLEGGQP